MDLVAHGPISVPNSRSILSEREFIATVFDDFSQSGNVKTCRFFMCGDLRERFCC